MPSFAQRLIVWQRRHGRHDLPWQGTRDPYRVWLAEIMLQQTQVATVIPYYQRFLERFPSLEGLADAPLEEVMALWSGLGYYARARNLHVCARKVVDSFGGLFPRDPLVIASLPGIGRSTANAIAAFCFGARVPILDGNVRRLLCRHRGITGKPGCAALERRLWAEAEALLPKTDIATYLQAQMDIGATICTRGKARCDVCPVAADCVAHREGRIIALPTPRTRKLLPERKATLLVVRAGDDILFERRPPAGIWGGLLCLPELPQHKDVADYARERLGARIDAVSRRPTFSHTFTHFRLTITPLLCTAARLPQVREDELVWLAWRDLAEAPLPAPIRKILSAIP